ncbi:MAG: efflux RND transporter periplasmic adaptor subunit [Gammaproteobacteria bacterium]|jgi:RND family efflux transporter MFP subunit|nr:efflux RND transporter periplasmic adaptor subunit [Gammaproteobacteria bacterium]
MLERAPLILVAALAAVIAAPGGTAADAPPAAALTVSTVAPRVEHWPVSIPAHGNLAAWQEAIVAAETGGLRVVALLADVGDTVRQGQALAQLSQDAVLADVALQEARVAQARAALSEAQANAERAREASGRPAMSEQQAKQYLVGEESAKANLRAAEAQLRSQQIRLDQTHIRAVDDGVVATRAATLGAVVQAGTELFRLVRQNRVEWRAEVMAEQLARIQPGQPARVRLAGGETVEGTVRVASPTFDPATRMALVYVDLPAAGAARPGMFARGEILVAAAPALTVPESAVVLRDGKSYVFVVGPERRVAGREVATGRRATNRVEVVSGLGTDERVVSRGGAFLADGDAVRVEDGAQAGRP